MTHGFMISAPTSGSGKTTIARGLMALLSRKGYVVQPMKCGPDYIDTKFHTAVTGRPSINIDLFMSTPEHTSQLAEQYAAGADVCIVEGMMGLYDGYDHDRGSAAEIARMLGLPVVMVVDARSAAYSMAPLLYGFKHWREDINISHVLFNRVGSIRHEQMLRRVCSDVGIECLGCIPRNKELENNERYLGLDFSNMSNSNALADIVGQNINLSSLYRLTGEPHILGTMHQASAITHHTSTNGIAIALNAESFSFVYQETLDHMTGAVTIDPETETTLPSGTRLLYLPGGYPEKHINELSHNTEMRRSIADFAAHGGRIVAECGGMMYLCQSILTDEGEFPMCGVLPYQVSIRKADRHLSLGYRRWTIAGHEMRGHEFHYSQFVGTQPESVCQVFNAIGEQVTSPIIRQDSVWASYIHLGPEAIKTLMTL